MEKELSKVILCEYLLSMVKGEPVKEKQMITIDKNTIHSVGPIPENIPKAKEVIRLNNHLVCPGLINTHTHLPMTLFRGLGDHLTLQKWLEEVIFPLEKKMVNPDFIRIGTELALLEMIQNGITTVCDMYFHTPVMAELFDSYGLRGVLAVDMLSSFSDWGTDLEDLCTRYETHQRIYPAIACHAPYTCSEELLKTAGEESQKRNIPISIHVAETEWEIAEIKKRYGKTPVFSFKRLWSYRASLRFCSLCSPE